MLHILRKSWLIGTTAFVAFIISGGLHAQSIYGTITGTVTDPSGASIAAAKVEAKNQGTSDVRVTSTDSQGIYNVPNLVPGTYTIIVSTDKFALSTNENIELQARVTATSNVQLQLAGSSATVEVTGDQSVVSVDPTLSTSTSGAEINSFALNFRASSSPQSNCCC